MTCFKLTLCFCVWFSFLVCYVPASIPSRTIFSVPTVFIPPSPQQAKIDEAQDPELSMNALEIIQHRGYSAEDHKVTTKDGYYLHLHRIPAPSKPVVFIQHGLVCSSDEWLVNPTNKSLPFILADNEYDVWLGNVRGNPYSNTHESKSNTSSDYWDFSWEDMGTYDIPAVINYILNHTGQANLTYIGHSMGTTIFWVAMESHPELNSKINLMIALAPVASLAHCELALQMATPLADMMQMFGVKIFIPNDLILPVTESSCYRNTQSKIFCMNLLTLSSEANMDENGEVQTDILESVLAHFPVDTSVKTMVHFVQVLRTSNLLVPVQLRYKLFFPLERFQRFDYGLFGNIQRYLQCQPPSFDLSKVTAPIILFSARADILTPGEDVEWLARQLPNLLENKKVNLSTFNHGDFLHAYQVVPLVYDHVLRSIKKYTSP